MADPQTADRSGSPDQPARPAASGSGRGERSGRADEPARGVSLAGADAAAGGDAAAGADASAGGDAGARADAAAGSDADRAGAGSSSTEVERRAGHVVVDIDPWSFVALVVATALAAALFAVNDRASDVLTGIGVGLLLGVALAPVVGAVQRRWHTTRGSAVVIVGTGLTIAVAAVVLLVAPAAIQQSREFSEELPSTVRDFYSWPIVGPRLEEADAARRVENWIQDAPARVDDATLAALGERLLGGVLSAFVVLVTALGVLIDGEVAIRRFRYLVPAAERGRADRAGRIVYATFGSYFAGSLFVAVLAGLVILSTGLLLGVPLAPVAGLWTALTNLIPQIGGFLGGGFFVLLALTQGPLTAVIAFVVVVAYQNLENHVISPAIVGRAVNLSPLATMMAALVGGAAAGVPGALVATPLCAAAKALYLERRGELPERETKVVRRRLSNMFHRRRRNPSGSGETPSAPAPDRMTR